MNSDERIQTIRAMRRFGGSFVRALASALEVADEHNAAKLVAAFPEYMRTYGPGGDQFNAVKDSGD